MLAVCGNAFTCLLLPLIQFWARQQQNNSNNKKKGIKLYCVLNFYYNSIRAVKSSLFWTVHEKHALKKILNIYFQALLTGTGEQNAPGREEKNWGKKRPPKKKRNQRNCWRQYETDAISNMEKPPRCPHLNSHQRGEICVNNNY